MKSIFVRTGIIYLLLFITIQIQGNSDGLYFKSSDYPAEERTTLTLNNGKPFEIKEQLEMAFNMDLRKKPFFGNIFCIKTNDGKHIDAIFSVQDGDMYKPTLVVDGKIQYINYTVESGINIPAKILLDKRNNKITFSYAGRKTTVNMDFTNSNDATFFFGMHNDENNYPDVAPMNVRNIRIIQNGKENYFWELRQHEKNICFDNISQAQAVAINGYWIWDNHIKWKTIFTDKSRKKSQITFNPDENIFYIADEQSVRCYDPVKQTTRTIKVEGGYRAMAYSNYIAYNTADKDLYTFNLQKGILSHFTFSTGKWSNNEPQTDEPAYFNHSWATNGDTVAYTFGGYGFYRYNNKLFRIIPGKNRIEELDYTPKLKPRTGAASVLVGNKLYIFGGIGNDTGKQELPCRYYYELDCIDLTTMKSEILWTTEGEQKTSFMLASEMLYNKDDNSFYAAVTNKGGRLIKIWLHEPKYEIVTDFMNVTFSYKDLTYNIYKSEKANKIYAVINKRDNNLNHEIAICSLDLPIQDNYSDYKSTRQASGNNQWLWWLVVIPIAACIWVTYRAIQKRQKPKEEEAEREKDDTDESAATATITENPEDKAPVDQDEKEDEDKQEEATKYYNPQGGCIQVLGKFIVKDRDGNDITPQFTKRTRNLLLMLLLHSETNNKGIEIHLLDEALWQEMNEESARNNRNVYMRKLRVLLEKVGDIEIVNDKIYYRINMGRDVFFDFREALAMMNKMEEEDDKETTARTLELLFEGPLLPNYSFEWLDKFKSDFSNTVISLLTRQMDHNQREGNMKSAYRIAKTIMQHDPFNEEALSTQCHILCKNYKRGIAKNVYDNFCKIYEQSIGEKYNRSFAEVCRTK